MKRRDFIKMGALTVTELHAGFKCGMKVDKCALRNGRFRCSNYDLL
jgi:hypothetical protein